MHINTISNRAPSNGTCVTGGDFPGYPETRPWAGKTYVSVAGNDTSFPAFKECCGAYPAQYVSPCTLWCEVGDTPYYETAACWDRHDFHPYAVDGASKIPGRAGGLNAGQIAGIAVGAVGAAAAIGGLVWWCCRRKRRAAAGYTGSSARTAAMTENVAAGGVKYGTVAKAGNDESKLRYSSDSSSQVAGAGRV